tara:strand:+ start:1733 stop:1918 length:186 start_codon:yes stop_codon:yes gene_type:complete
MDNKRKCVEKECECCRFKLRKHNKYKIKEQEDAKNIERQIEQLKREIENAVQELLIEQNNL